jgi:hypothetical protein
MSGYGSGDYASDYGNDSYAVGHGEAATEGNPVDSGNDAGVADYNYGDVPTLTRNNEVGVNDVSYTPYSTGPQWINPYQSDPRSLAAQLLNAQFAEWEATFQPIERSLLQEVSFVNPSVLPTAVNKASNAAKQTSSTMGGILERVNKSQGIENNANEANVMKRLLNLNTAENIAGSVNTARENVRTQDEQILLGTTPNFNVQKSS